MSGKAVGRTVAALAGALVLAASGVSAQAAPAVTGATAPAAAPAPATAGTVIDSTDASFDREVVQSDKPVLVSFCAEWAEQCRMLDPVLRDVAGDYAGRAKVVRHDIDREPETHPKYDVTAVPTLNVFKNGQIVATRIGPSGKADVVKLLNRAGV
ncbi:hypothetical protein HCC30_05400 [Streptomyces sp. HNM0574]|nr:thioredoxin domain-containing protein [Streptomyces sp. HNM0574]NLU66704.1 hypothetical protein [Streptomyces sp. HNM0574]